MRLLKIKSTVITSLMSKKKSRSSQLKPKNRKRKKLKRKLNYSNLKLLSDSKKIKPTMQILVGSVKLS